MDAPGSNDLNRGLHENGERSLDLKTGNWIMEAAELTTFRPGQVCCRLNLFILRSLTQSKNSILIRLRYSELARSFKLNVIFDFSVLNFVTLECCNSFTCMATGPKINRVIGA